MNDEEGRICVCKSESLFHFHFLYFNFISKRRCGLTIQSTIFSHVWILISIASMDLCVE